MRHGKQGLKGISSGRISWKNHHLKFNSKSIQLRIPFNFSSRFDNLFFFCLRSATDFDILSRSPIAFNKSFKSPYAALFAPLHLPSAKFMSNFHEFSHLCVFLKMRLNFPRLAERASVCDKEFFA